MVRSRENKSGRKGQIGSRMPVASRKNVIAAALMIVMGIMWARVLTGRKPKSSTAKPATTQTQAVQDRPALNVSFIELPVVAGRNDRVHRDFFTVHDWKAFSKVSTSQAATMDSEVPVVTSNWDQEVVARVAQRFRLEAVLPPNAMINDRLVKVGSSIRVKDGADTYVFEVVQVDEDSVVVARDGHRLTLKLDTAQSNDVSN